MHVLPNKSPTIHPSNHIKVIRVVNHPLLFIARTILSLLDQRRDDYREETGRRKKLGSREELAIRSLLLLGSLSS